MTEPARFSGGRPTPAGARGLLRRLKTFASPSKISKLKLSSGYAALLRGLFGSLLGRLARGPAADNFEHAFSCHFGGEPAIIFPRARTAFYFILKAMDLPAGSEVLMSPLTIPEMVNSIHTLGLKPVFVDIDPETLCINPARLAAAVTPRSRVLFITYLFGVVPDMDALLREARRHGLRTVEDCSQCFDGAFNGRKAGTFSDASFFSLTNFKLCSSLLGGMALTADPALRERLLRLRDAEVLPPRRGILLTVVLEGLLYRLLFSRLIFLYFTYFVLLALEKVDPSITNKLYSGDLLVLLGLNKNRLLEKFPEEWLADYSDMQAKIGLESLEKAAAATLLRARNGARLRAALANLPQVRVPGSLPGARNVYWRFPVTCSRAADLKMFLLEAGVDSSPTFLTLCSAEPGFELYRAAMPETENLKHNTVVLEVNEDLSELDMDRTAALVREFFSGDASRRPLPAPPAAAAGPGGSA